MHRQTKHLIELALKADPSVTGVHYARIMEAVNMEHPLPDKLCLTQREAAYVLSMSRQSVRNLVQKGVIQPVDISGEGMLRYPLKQLVDLIESRSSES